MTKDNVNKVAVREFPITAAQFLKWAGAVLTGGEAKELIREGYVLVNSEVITAPAQKLKPDDVVEILGEDPIRYLVAEDKY